MQYSINRPASGDGDAPFKTGAVAVTAAQIAKTTDEAAALLGYALSSPQKVSLLRALLGQRRGERGGPGSDGEPRARAACTIICGI